MEDIMQLIGNLGFPIAVTVYVLVRLEAKLENLVIAINQLSAKIGKEG